MQTEEIACVRTLRWKGAWRVRGAKRMPGKLSGGELWGGGLALGGIVRNMEGLKNYRGRKIRVWGQTECED